MKTLLEKILSAALLAAALLSCTKPDSGDNGDDSASMASHYILNNGAWKANNASVTLYDAENGTTVQYAFQKANGKALGDLAQDIISCGDDIYIAVNGSQIIFVTDRSLKIKKEIVTKEGETVLSPRYFTHGGGKLYVTYYEGYLAEIDPKTYEVRTTPVGPNPENPLYLDGKIYTADSGGFLPGYNDKLSVVDAASFEKTGEITVGTNPKYLRAYGNKLYVWTAGNYYDISPKVMCVSLPDGGLSELDYDAPVSIAIDGDFLYVLSGGYAPDYSLLPGTVHKYDLKTGRDMGNAVTDGTELKQAYSLSATDGLIWVGSSDFTGTGCMYAIDASSGKVSTVEAGVNPEIAI